jgi:mannosyltransferase
MLGSRLFGRTAGLLAAWLLAINAYHIRYAQEARSYSLLVFLAVLATWLFTHNIEQQSKARWGLYSFVAVLMVYAHFFGALLVAAHGISLLALAPGKAPWRNFGKAVRWIVLMTIPLVAVIVLNGNASSFWLVRPGWRDLAGFFTALAGNGGGLLLTLEVAALSWAAVAAWREWHSAGRNAATWTYALLFSWLFSPLAIVLSLSVWRPVFVARFLIFCLPALALALAAGIAKLRPAPLSGLVLCAISALSMQGAFSYYKRDFDLWREDWRSATAWITSHSQPGDAIFFPTFGRMPYEYYKSRYAPGAPSPQVPQVLNSPGAAALEPRDFAVRSVAEMLRDSKPAPDRVWLVLFLDRTPAGQENPTSAMLRAWYGKNRTLVSEQEFAQIRVYLYARDASPVVDAEARAN